MAAHLALRLGTVSKRQLVQRDGGAELRRDGDDGVAEAQFDAFGTACDLVAIADGGVDLLGEGLALVGCQLAIEGLEVHFTRTIPQGN